MKPTALKVNISWQHWYPGCSSSPWQIEGVVKALREAGLDKDLIAAHNGTVTVDVTITDPLPNGARPDLSVDGTVEISNIKDVLYVGRPVHGQENSTIGIFKVTEDGSEATRVNVKLGRSSVNTVEILEGLKVGDKVILSDMSAWDNFDRVRLK